MSMTQTPGPSTSYLILHEHRGCGAAPASFLVIRCWYANDDQCVLFTGSRNDATEYLRAHWSDTDPRALPAIPHASTNEKLIVGRLVRDLLSAGYCLTVYNGGDDPELELSSDEAAIFAALCASSEDEIIAYTIATQRRAGWIRLVWGNDCDVICDYTTNFEAVLDGANALAEELSA